MVFAFLRIGLKQTWRYRKIWLFFYLLNLLCGILITLPWRTTLHDFLEHSLMNDSLGGPLDWHPIIELFLGNPALNATLVTIFFVTVILYIGGNIFLSGGSFYSFIHQSHYGSTSFWGHCGHFWGRFFRLSIWTVLVFIILFATTSAFVSGLVRLFWGSDPYESVLYWSNWIKIIIGYIVIVLSYLFYDYARIYIVQTDERKTRSALFNSIKFVFANLRRTFTLIFAIWFIGTGALFIYNPIADRLGHSDTITIVALFIFQQLFMLFRAGLKTTLFAGEVSLFNTLFFNK